MDVRKVLEENQLRWDLPTYLPTYIAETVSNSLKNKLEVENNIFSENVFKKFLLHAFLDVSFNFLHEFVLLKIIF